jgi:acid phosphatase class B
MENLVEGKVYQKKVECFEKRMQTEDEFLDDVYQEFYVYKLKTPERENYLDYPDFYEELNNEQKKEVQIYIEENKLKPEVVCISYTYSPSNYFKDEVNAHTETLNANNKAVFKMSNEKIDIYNGEINRYTSQYNKAKEYEKNNNINEKGYEK